MWTPELPVQVDPSTPRDNELMDCSGSWLSFSYFAILKFSDISIPIAAPTESSGPLHYFPSTVAKTGARQLYKMWKNHHSEELLCLEQFGIGKLSNQF